MTHSATGTLEFKAENLEHLVNILYLNAFVNYHISKDVRLITAQ